MKEKKKIILIIISFCLLIFLLFYIFDTKKTSDYLLVDVDIDRNNNVNNPVNYDRLKT